jgi:hypothetical protein
MTTRDPAHGEPDLDDSLRLLAEDDARVKAPDRVYAKVMAAWDGEIARGQGPGESPESRQGIRQTPPRRVVSGTWLGRAAALAAAAVLAIAWIVARGSYGESRTEPPVARTTIPISAATNLMTVPPLDSESLQLVRVRMPRGALRAFGIPLVDPDAAAEVEVDVIVGEDGFPRSIRRVQPIAASSQ